MEYKAFVYGTLKGQPRWVDGKQTFVATGQTTKNFNLFGGGYPVAAHRDDVQFPYAAAPIRGEIVLIDEDAAKFFDRYEGYPDWYDRETTPVTDDNGDTHICIMYIGSGVLESIASRPLITPNDESVLEWQ